MVLDDPLPTLLKLIRSIEKHGCQSSLIIGQICVFGQEFCVCSMTLPHSSVGWSAVSDCGIS